MSSRQESAHATLAVGAARCAARLVVVHQPVRRERLGIVVDGARVDVDLLLPQGAGRERHLARAGCAVDTGNVWVQPGGQHGGHDSPVARVPVGAWQSPPVVSWTPVRESQRARPAVVHRAALSPCLHVEKPDVVELAAELRGHVFDSLQRFDAQEMFAAPLALEIAAVFVANLGAKNERNRSAAGELAKAHCRANAPCARPLSR